MKDDKHWIKKWEKDINKVLLGRKIAKIEYLNDNRVIYKRDPMMWYKRPIAIILDDGNWLVPMADDEGNDGGAIATSYKDLGTIPVI